MLHFSLVLIKLKEIYFLFVYKWLSMPDDMGTKNKSLSTNEKNQKGKDGKNKKDKKGPSEKREVSVTINQNEAEKIIQNSKVITAHELAKQTNVKISTANAFLVKSLNEGSVKRVGGFSGHHIYVPASQ